MSGGSYQPFDLSQWVGADTLATPLKGVSKALASTVATSVASSVAAQDSFPDWGKGADFRRFRRERDGTVASVASVAAPRLPWADGLDILQRLPAPGWMPYEQWERLVYIAVSLSRDWGAQAHSLGWNEIDLFGCNLEPWKRRVDRNGLAMLLSRWSGPIKVAAITDQSVALTVDHGHTLQFRHFDRLGSVPIWVAFSQEAGP